MQVRLLSSSSAEMRDSQQSIATVSGSRNWLRTFQQDFQRALFVYTQNSSDSFSSVAQRFHVLDATQNSDNFEEMEHVIFSKEIDIEEWKNSLNYSDETLNRVIEEFLADYDINPNTNNKDWFKTVINTIIENYEKEYSISLDQETRHMLKNLITKMSYDKLCIKKSSSK